MRETLHRCCALPTGTFCSIRSNRTAMWCILSACRYAVRAAKIQVLDRGGSAPSPPRGQCGTAGRCSPARCACYLDPCVVGRAGVRAIFYMFITTAYAKKSPLESFFPYVLRECLIFDWLRNSPKKQEFHLLSGRRNVVPSFFQSNRMVRSCRNINESRFFGSV